MRARYDLMGEEERKGKGEVEEGKGKEVVEEEGKGEEEVRGRASRVSYRIFSRGECLCVRKLISCGHRP